MSNPCVVCGRPLPDVAYACPADALSLSESLAAASGHAEDAETGIGRQARPGAGSRGSSSDGVTYDATRSAQLGSIRTSARFWGEELRDGADRPPWRRIAGPPCPIGVRCPHRSCAQVRATMPPSDLAQELAWLAEHADQLRKHPAADEAFRDLREKCELLARLVDRPPDKVLFGQCDCGKVLYAATDKVQIRCPVQTCGQVWHVERSREILRAALDSRLVTEQEAARLGQYLDSDRTQDNIRKLIAGRVRSGRLVAHGQVDTEDGPAPIYRFGEIALMLATIPKRTRKVA